MSKIVLSCSFELTADTDELRAHAEEYNVDYDEALAGSADALREQIAHDWSDDEAVPFKLSNLEVTMSDESCLLCGEVDNPDCGSAYHLDRE